MFFRSVFFRSRHRAVSLLLLATFCTLTGCNGSTGNKNKSNGGGEVGNDKTTLRVGIAGDLTTLDPARVPDLLTFQILAQCFDGLVRYNEKNEIEPALAEKWDISPDGKTYTFHLRHGVTFHDGSPFKASDVKYSWERALNPDTKSPVANNYLEGVLGMNEVHKGTAKELTGVQAVDDYTLKVQIDRPRAYFLGMVAYPTNFIVNRTAIEKNGGKYNDKTVSGTGAFIFEAYTPGQQVSLKANTGYWGGSPKMARIVYPIIKDPSTSYSKYEADGLDMTGVDVQRYSQDKQANKFTDQYHVQPVANVTYIVMHGGKQPVFNNPDVRRAFAMAIDRNEIIRVAFQGVGTRADGMIPPELLNGASQPPAIPYDPAQAKALLAKAGFPDGKNFPSLTLTIQEKSPALSGAAQIMVSELNTNLHINVQSQEREGTQFTEDWEKNRMEFYITGWIADYPDPQDFLSTLLATGAEINYHHYSNPTFDALCSQADSISDQSKRLPLYQKANALLMQEVGILPLVFQPRIVLAKPNVQGWRGNLCSRLPDTQTTK